MPPTRLSSRAAALLVVLGLALAAALLSAAARGRDGQGDMADLARAAPSSPVGPVRRATLPPATWLAQANTPAAAPAPSATPAPPPTETPAGPTAVVTPSPRAAGTPWRVGLQVGHWKANELPEELERLRTSTGARYGTISEADLNLDIAQRVKARLEAQGVVVDLLPATVPPAYDADAFLAIHADGSASAAARGWKLATPWRASAASKQLLAAVAAAYGPATGLPEDVGGVTFNMRGYYAFSYRRHTHAVARTTPAIIVEMGFMTSAADRAVLFGQPDRVARGIADGVLGYLRGRDPSDGAALLPPDFPMLRALPGATLRAAPRDGARVLLTLNPEQRLSPFDRQDGWYQVFVRGEWRLLGWVREDQVEATSDPVVLPTPTNP